MSLVVDYKCPKAGDIQNSKHRSPLVGDELAHRFSMLLDSLGMNYDYEPSIFYFRAKRLSKHLSRCFQPDFYLPEWDYYIEICSNRRSKKKQHSRMMVRNIFPDQKISFLYTEEIEVLYQHKENGTLTWEMMLVMLSDRSASNFKDRHTLRRWNPDGDEHLVYPFVCK